MRWKALVMVLAIAAAVGGCQQVKIDVPSSFVSVGKDNLGPYDQRAVSADGVVLACRTQDNEKHGTLKFWAKAIKNELASKPGYALTSDDSAHSYAGLEGRLLVFSATRQGAAFTYMLGVFVKGNRVILTEAGGRAEAVKPLIADLKAALLSVR